MTLRAAVAMLLAYGVPGAGHFFLGRRARALAFFGLVAFLFVLGLAIDGALYTFTTAGGETLSKLAAAGSMGSGALYFVARAVGPAGEINSPTFEYGRMFTLSAGLMNLLLVLDCYDIAAGRKR